MEKRFSTKQVAARDRRAYWIEAVRSAYGRVDCEIPDTNFSADVHERSFGQLRLSRVERDARTISRSASQIGAVDNEFLQFGFQLTGRAYLDQDGRATTIGSGDVKIFDTTRPFLLRSDERCVTLVAQLPRKQFTRRMGRIELFTGNALSCQNPLVQTVRRFLIDLHANIDNQEPTTSARLEECAVELLLTALNVERGERTPRQSSRVATLYRLRSYIDAHLHDHRLTPDQVAAGCGVSPRHQRFLFAAEGDSPAAYIWAQRLRRCKRDLADPRLRDRNISDIAYAWGFGDMTYFSHMFRKSEGMSARDYRERHAIAGKSGAG